MSTPLNKMFERLSSMEDRLCLDVLPLLAAQTVLTNSLRVLSELYAQEQRQEQAGVGDLGRELAQACPTWLDPLASGEEWRVVSDLARNIEDRALAIIQSHGNGAQT